MSYEQFLGQWQESARRDGCVNPYDPDAVYPEHREDEAWERDPLFDRHPDDFGEHPLSPLDRQLFQDCRKVQGKVVGRHEAMVRTPWYLTSQYLSRTLGCPVAQAAQLADSFAILDADAAMVDTFFGWVKARGLDAALAYFSTLATAAAEAEGVDPDDALHHATESYQDWEHDRAVAERDDDLTTLPDLAWRLWATSGRRWMPGWGGIPMIPTATSRWAWTSAPPSPRAGTSSTSWMKS